MTEFDVYMYCGRRASQFFVQKQVGTGLSCLSSYRRDGVFLVAVEVLTSVVPGDKVPGTNFKITKSQRKKVEPMTTSTMHQQCIVLN